MTVPWLVLDCDYLCHRAFHAMGRLSHEGSLTGVVYGFLRDVKNLQEQFDSSRLVFCFDCRKSLRNELYPDYKRGRQVAAPKPIESKILGLDDLDEETQRRIELRRQIKNLRKE